VLCQVQHQLAVTGKQAAHICVLLCGHETKIYKVSRNEAVIEQIIQAERYFGNVLKMTFHQQWMPVNRQPKLYNSSIQNIPTQLC
jgi:predicted phage-related endonuclease